MHRGESLCVGVCGGGRPGARRREGTSTSRDSTMCARRAGVRACVIDQCVRDGCAWGLCMERERETRTGRPRTLCREEDARSLARAVCVRVSPMHVESRPVKIHRSIDASIHHPSIDRSRRAIDRVGRSPIGRRPRDRNGDGDGNGCARATATATATATDADDDARVRRGLGDGRVRDDGVRRWSSVGRRR